MSNAPMSNAQSPNGAIANGWTDFSADPEPSVPSDCITEDAEPAPSASNATATFTSSASLSPNAEPNSDPSSERSCDLSADSWRVEVAARLERYRTRRKARTPRYPSLLLPFDAPENWSRATRQNGSGMAATALERSATHFQTEPAQVADDIFEPPFLSKPVMEPVPETLARRYPEPS